MYSLLDECIKSPRLIILKHMPAKRHGVVSQLYIKRFSFTFIIIQSLYAQKNIFNNSDYIEIFFFMSVIKFLMLNLCIKSNPTLVNN